MSAVSRCPCDGGRGAGRAAPRLRSTARLAAGEGMSWTDIAFDCLKEQRLETIVYVPDIVLADLIRRVEADSYFTAISPTREEEGVGIISGAYLGGKRGVLMMQNSGVGNAANAIAGLINPCQIPFIMLINPRG